MSFISVIVGHKLAAGLIALGTITVGGTAAAAYADALPGGLQEEAHTLIGAPTASPSADPTALPTAEPTDSATPTSTPTSTPSPDPTSTDVPVGPDASGPAAHGLCTAFEHGGLASTSVAFASLERASGGVDKIDAYCATIVEPEHSGDDRHTSTPEPAETDEPKPHAEHTETPERADPSDAPDTADSSHSERGSGHH